MQSSDEVRDDVRRLKNAVFGNPDSPKETPGVIAELAQMTLVLGEMRDAMRRINMTLIIGFLTALMALVFKGVTHT